MGKSPRLDPQVIDDGHRRSTDVIPELATREAQDEFHTGVRFVNISCSDRSLQ